MEDSDAVRESPLGSENETAGWVVVLLRGERVVRNQVVLIAVYVCVSAIGLMGCQSPMPRQNVIESEAELQRFGDEIVVAGEWVRTGTPVVLWSDPGGYDAYQTTRHFGGAGDGHQLDGERRYGERPGSDAGGWTLPKLADSVDQFVVHYDVSGTSRNCFRVLHDVRGLSVHFLLDVDGTIYQTLDVQERAWHATKANDRSVGIEIAHIGAYPPERAGVLDDWYVQDAGGRTRLRIPERFDGGGVRMTDTSMMPARDEPVRGRINGSELVMYDFTPEQYESLAHLLAALNRALPDIRLEAPRDRSSAVKANVLGVSEFETFSGVLGHYHVQRNKVDPGPAFQWDSVLSRARELRAQRE